MHLAWNIEELRGLVLEYLKPRDLARLARTCKFFWIIATDNLWGTLTSFTPFLSCLPTSFKTKPLSKANLERLDLYSTKVHTLALDIRVVGKISHIPAGFYAHEWKPSTKKSWKVLWDEIANLRSPSEFLPNLRYLRLNDVDHQLLVPIIGITGEHLKEAYMKKVNGNDSDITVKAILDGFTHTPNLEYLFIRNGVEMLSAKMIQESPLKHLRLDPRFQLRWQHLNHARPIPLRTEILEKSSLEQLTISISQNWVAPEVSATRAKYLPALKSLWLDLTQWRLEGRIKHVSVYERQRFIEARGWTMENSPLGPIDDSRWTEPILDVPFRYKKSPAVFFEGLDNPQLQVLHIKLSQNATSISDLLEILSAAKKNCRLQYLTGLALVGMTETHTCSNCISPDEKISPAELRMGLSTLLPLPHLKHLRLSIAPNLLDHLDLDMYRSIAEQLPALEILWLGHVSMNTERTSVHNLAAFCHMFPKLVDVSLSWCDMEPMSESPNPDWVSPGVKTLKISRLVNPGELIPVEVVEKHVERMIRTYFPQSDLVGRKLNTWSWVFMERDDRLVG